MIEPAVQVDGVHKRYGQTHALRGVDLTVAAGSVCGLLGPNGAGKTTLVRILATLTRPDEGRAMVAGYDVVREADQVRYRIGLAGQHAAVDEKLPGRDNLRMFGLLTTCPSGWRGRADELLDQFGLTDAAGRVVKTYSGGMRRRLDIAASLIVAPPVLFLDEPTTGLDPRSRSEVWDLPARAGSGRHDGDPDHAVPGRGRPAGRPDRGDRRGHGRGGGHAGAAEGADGRGPAGRRVPAADRRRGGGVMTTMDALVMPARPRTWLGRLASGLRDGWTITRREFGHVRYEPGQLLGALIFPGVMVVLFGYVFGSAISVPGGGNYREYLMPGLFAMASVLGLLPSALMVSKDVAEGVVDRFRSMPIARSAVPFGRTLADLLSGSVGLAIMAGIGLLVGWRARDGIGGAAAGFALLLALRYGLTWAGVFMGLSMRPETVDSFVPLVFPVTMISNSFVPTGGMPGWLQAIANSESGERGGRGDPRAVRQPDRGGPGARLAAAAPHHRHPRLVGAAAGGVRAAGHLALPVPPRWPAATASHGSSTQSPRVSRPRPAGQLVDRGSAAAADSGRRHPALVAARQGREESIAPAACAAASASLGRAVAIMAAAPLTAEATLPHST